MTIRQVSWGVGGLLLVALVVLLQDLGNSAPAVRPEAAEAPRVEAPPAAPAPAPRVTNVPTLEVVAAAPRPAGLPDALEVELDGRVLSLSLDEVRAVPRAGGTHDVRELATALLGVTGGTVRVEGELETGGARRAAIDLARLGPSDQLRIWPEADGTWTVARNRTSLDGTATVEAYRLAGVRRLTFQRGS